VVTLAVMHALLGYTSEARWLRYAEDHLRHLFGYLPRQPGYDKRLRKLAGTLNWLIGLLARDTDRRVRIGVRMWELALRASPTLSLREAAMPYLEDLHAVVGHHAQEHVIGMAVSGIAG